MFITFSPYQAKKAGLIGQWYTKADILIQLEKLKKAEKVGHRLALVYRENIEFISRMINQQILESVKY